MSTLAYNMISCANKFNTKLMYFFMLPYVKYSFLLFIVIRILFINKTPLWTLQIFNSNSVKILYSLFIAYSACFDPIYSISLATYIIMCIQELHIRTATEKLKNNIPSVELK